MQPNILRKRLLVSSIPNRQLEFELAFIAWLSADQACVALIILETTISHLHTVVEQICEMAEEETIGGDHAQRSGDPPLVI